VRLLAADEYAGIAEIALDPGLDGAPEGAARQSEGSAKVRSQSA
jgi:hypothetical protein